MKSGGNETKKGKDKIKDSNNSKITVLYENADIIVKKLNDSGKIYAGYKGEMLYPLYGLVSDGVFTNGKDWTLTYKRGTEIFPFRTKPLMASLVWIDGVRFWDMNDNGRYISNDGSNDGIIMSDVRLEQTGNNGNCKDRFVVGFQQIA